MSRDERLARNENYVREINESLSEKHLHATVVRSGRLPFVCECADPACTEAVELTLDEYQAIRRNPRRFVVVPGHEQAELEVVVEREAGHAVVEKVGAAGAKAQADAPA